jgi:hypothetical protein
MRWSLIRRIEDEMKKFLLGACRNGWDENRVVRIEIVLYDDKD